jgi:integrase
LQENFISKNGEVLIGSKDKLPRISVANRINGCKGKLHNSLVHKSMPVNCSREPKHPISQYTIERIEQMIEAVSIVANQNDRTLRRYRSNLSLFEEKLQYLRARRRFMIWLLKRTGLRPSEMVEMKVTDHLHILQNLKLIIPTKKRRRHNAPNRSFPISLKDAATVQRYLSCRDRFISYLGKVSSSVPDVFFLGDNGSAIKKSSLEKDFSRLAKLSGFVDTQVCISMFRHRFITFEVIVHFKEFLECSGKTRQIMTDADYRSILRRIASKTGHGSEESLWHYIDLAWAELDVWGGVERALERLQAADQLFEQLLDLKTFAVNQSRNDIAAELGKIIDDASTFRN